MFFMLSCLRGVSAFPRPGFWATLYLFYLFGAEYLFYLAAGNWKLPLLSGTLNFGVAYLSFRAMHEYDEGLPYWVAFALGFFLTTSVLP